MTDRPTVDPESAQADRWHRREHLGVLLSRAARGVLTPKEGPALRAAVDTELADAEDAHRRAEQRDTYRAAWHSARDRARQRSEERDRARRWAVHLENENRRLEDQTKEAKERARVAVVAAYNLKRQTPDAAQRTLDRVRQARTWCDLWVQLGMYYGLKPEECGLEARDRRTTAERTAEARAERAEQQAAKVRAVLAEVLAQFTHNTHPGTPCKQTGHVNVATIDRWRAALDTAGQPDCPSCEAGIEHDVHCPTPETHNHGCPCSPAGGEAGR